DRLGIHRAARRRRRLHDLRSHGRRSRPVRDHARDQHDRLRCRLSKSLGRRGRLVKLESSPEVGAPSSGTPPLPRLTGAGPEPSRTAERTPPVPRVRRPRRVREFTTNDRISMAGCAFSAAAFSWLVYTKLTEGTGWLGFLLTAYAVFLFLLYIVTSDQLGRLAAVDRVVMVVVVTSAVVLLVPL